MFHPIRHFITITHHRNLVFYHCVKCGIPFRGLVHDLSKYSLEEFIPGAKYWVGTRSPNDLERKENGYSKAWIHHKGRNKHHYEYWYDFQPGTGIYKPIKMPLKYVVEMFCDRIAAGKVYKGKDFDPAAPYDYFATRRGDTQMHPETEALLADILLKYKEWGEKKTFSYIRKTLIKQKNY